MVSGDTHAKAALATIFPSIQHATRSSSYGNIKRPLKYFPDWLLLVWMFRNETWVFTHLYQPGKVENPLVSSTKQMVGPGSQSFSSFPCLFKSKTSPSAKTSMPCLVDTGPLTLVHTVSCTKKCVWRCPPSQGSKCTFITEFILMAQNPCSLYWM